MCARTQLPSIQIYVVQLYAVPFIVVLCPCAVPPAALRCVWVRLGAMMGLFGWVVLAQVVATQAGSPDSCVAKLSGGKTQE